MFSYEVRVLEKLKTTLTREEAASIYLYTTNALYDKLNQDLRDFDDELSRSESPWVATRQALPALNKKWGPYLHLLIHALQKLPNVQATVWRGITLPRQMVDELKHSRNNTISWVGLSSSSREKSTAHSFATWQSLSRTRSRILFQVKTKYGKCFCFQCLPNRKGGLTPALSIYPYRVPV